MGYTRAAIKGVSWLAIFRGVTRGLSFIRIFFLARLLTPAQFGVFGVATLVLALVEALTETGVNVILIQEQDSFFKKYVNSAWVVSIVRGMLIAGCIIVTAPLVATFFHDSEVISLLYLISLVPLIRGFINPSLVLWSKKLEFQKEVMMRSVITIVGVTVSIITAYIWRTPLALGVGMVVEALLEAAFTLIWIKPRPRFSFQKQNFMFVLSRGKWLTVAGVLVYLFQQLDDIVVGRRLGQTSLGYYQMAYKLAILPITEISDVFGKVLFPVYTKVRDDVPRLRRAFGRSTGMIAVLTIPFGVILVFFPETIVRIAFGSQWLPVVPLLPVLGIFGVLRAISNSCYALFLAVKKQEYATLVTLVGIVGMGITLWPLVTQYGMLGAAWSALLATIFTAPVIIYCILKSFRSSNTSDYS